MNKAVTRSTASAKAGAKRDTKTGTEAGTRVRNKTPAKTSGKAEASIDSSTNSKAQRSHNRLQLVRDAAATLFATRGYKATTMRDIASQAGMQPGSLYYHYASKQDLLLDIYQLAVEQALERLNGAVDVSSDPVERFELAVICHTETMLNQDNYARIMTGVLPADSPEIGAELANLRAAYEDVFRALIDALPLPSEIDRRMLRLFVLGAINSTRVWYKEGGMSEAEIGDHFMRILRRVME